MIQNKSVVERGWRVSVCQALQDTPDPKKTHRPRVQPTVTGQNQMTHRKAVQQLPLRLDARTHNIAPNQNREDTPSSDQRVRERVRDREKERASDRKSVATICVRRSP